MNITIDELEDALIEGLLSLENPFGSCLKNPDSMFTDDDIFENWSPDISPSYEEPYSSVNPIKNNSLDIPTDPREWLVTDQTTRRQRPPRLYEFLILLLHKAHYASYASYKDRALGLFEIYEPEKVADLWQQVKNRQSMQKMTYDKFARAIRWYYKADIMRKTNARYTFQFSPKTLAGIIIDENNNITINSPM
jgi:hypothetical protein